jgi:peptidoglycan-associated lipoprotein
MKKRLMIGLTLLLVFPGLLFSVSCAKKVGQPDKAITDDAAAAKIAAQKAAAAEAEAQKQKQLKEMAMADEVKKAKEKFVNENVHFAYDSSALTATAQIILDQKAKWLIENPNVNVIIEGHCDERGTVAYNLALGERRAESAKRYLLDLGVPAARLSTVSYGEESPLDPGKNEEAWARNRRAQFTIP